VHAAPARHGSGAGVGASVAEGGESVDEPQGREREVRAPIPAGLRQAVDPSLSAGCLQALQGEGRSGAVSEQTFSPVSISALDPNLGINREAPAMVPALSLSPVGPLRESAAAHEPAQQSAAHRRPHRGHR